MAQDELQNRIEDLKVALAEAMNRLHSAGGGNIVYSTRLTGLQTNNPLSDRLRFNRNNNVEFNLASNIYEVNSLSNNNDSLLIKQSGVYKIEFYVSQKGKPNTGQTMTFNIMHNNATLLHHPIELQAGSARALKSHVFSTLNIDQGDIISFIASKSALTAPDYRAYTFITKLA